MASRRRRLIISACLIVRDEGRVLGRCLNSIQGAFDELCILDTGSVDNTPQIARRFGARFSTFTSCNGPDGKIADFAMARNACIQMARGDWILSIDADEVLKKTSVERIRWHAQYDDSVAVRVCMRSRATEWLVVRLFRRLPEHQFFSRVHEWVSIEGSVSDDWSIVIRNLPDKRGKESAVLRDLRLCSLALKEEPQNPRMIFYLARALRRSGRFDAAVKEYQRYLELEKEFRPGRHAAAHGIAVCHLLRGKWRDAIRAGKMAMAIDPRLAESHCLVADAYMGLSQYNRAIRWYQSALTCEGPPPDHPFFVDRSFYSKYPLHQLRLFEVSLSEKRHD